MSNKDSYSLNINDISFDSEGVKDYCCPISPLETREMGEYVYNIFYELDKKLKNNKENGCKFFSMCFQDISDEILRYILSGRLLQNISEKCRNIDVPSNYTKTFCLYNKLKFPDLLLLTKLRAGVPRPKKSKVLLRFVRDIWRGYVTKIPRVSIKFLFKKITYALDDSQQIYRFCKKNNIDNIVYKRVHHWFPGAEKKLDLDGAHFNSILDIILSSVEVIFYTCKVELSEKLKEHLYRNIKTILLYVEHYYKQISFSKIRPPERFLTCSGPNSIWLVMLREFYDNKGIETIVFTHGSGILSGSQLKYSKLSANGNFFCVYSAREAGNFYDKNNLRFFYEPYSISDKYVKVIKNIGTIKKVLYASTICYGDSISVQYSGLLPDVAYADWIIRLLYKLKEFEFDFSFRPHPVDSLSMVDPSFLIEKEFPLKIEKRSFENIFLEFDVIIIDYLNTSILPVLLFSGVPFVYVDIGLSKIDQDLYDSLAKRCPIVRAELLDNRVHIDWNELFIAISDAPKYMDNEFFNKFYLNKI